MSDVFHPLSLHNGFTMKILHLAIIAAILVAREVEGFAGRATIRESLSIHADRQRLLDASPSARLSYADPFSRSNNFALKAEADGNSEKSKLPFFLDPGTKGGAVFLSLVLFIVPIIFYNIITTFFGVDEIEAGKWIGVGFTVIATLGWVSTYLFRVATKDMTYAKQLKDYENAVIAKRLEELDEDELQALQEEVERDQF